MGKRCLAVILPGEYDYIFSISDTVVGLEKEEKCYLTNHKGEIISIKSYSEIKQFIRRKAIRY